MPDHTVRIETPAANELPALQSQLSDARERLARLEERTQTPDPAISSANDLASETARELAATKKEVSKLTKKMLELEQATLEPVETVDDPKPVLAANEKPNEPPAPAPTPQPIADPIVPPAPAPVKKRSLMESIFG